MYVKEHVYSILIISATDSFSMALSDLLPESRYTPVSTVNSIRAAKDVLVENTFDFVLINTPLPDDTGTRFAIDLCSAGKSVVMMLVKKEFHADIHDKVAEHGVFTLSKPTQKSTLSQALGWLESARERLRQFEKSTLSLDEKMAEIRLVNRAKCILIHELQMNESDAHHYIEKQSMDCCQPKKSIAEDIIRRYA